MNNFTQTLLILEKRETFLVYHGTDSRFDSFDLQHLGTANGTAPINMTGFNFTDSIEVARTFGKHIITAIVTIRHPYVIDAKGRNYSEFKHVINVKLDQIDITKYDGVIIRNYADAGTYGDDYILSNHYIPFNVEQIQYKDIL